MVSQILTANAELDFLPSAPDSQALLHSSRLHKSRHTLLHTDRNQAGLFRSGLELDVLDEGQQPLPVTSLQFSAFIFNICLSLLTGC